MKKHVLTAAAISMLIVGTQALAATHEIKMLNSGADGTMVFEPGFIKVNRGDTVTFVPAEPAHNSASHYVPAGAAPWSGAINKPITVTFEQEGVYLYKCDPHVPLGMVGVIQVGAPVNFAEAKQAAEEFKGSIAMNKDRIEKYFSQIK